MRLIVGCNESVVRFHKFKSFAHVGWYLTIESNLTAFALNCSRLQICIVCVIYVEAVAQTAQVYWHHGSIMDLGKGGFVRETTRKPFCIIVTDTITMGPHLLSFEERVFLPSAAWKTLLFLDLPWTGFWWFATFFGTFKSLLCFCQGPDKKLSIILNIMIKLSKIKRANW